jgi:hypothetical protein
MASLLYPIPSFSQGFARNATQALFPNLWTELVLLGAPYIGHQGQMLYDRSIYRNDGTLTSMTNDDWKIGENGLALDCSGNNWINCGDSPSLQFTKNFTVVAGINTSSVTSFRHIVAKYLVGGLFPGWALAINPQAFVGPLGFFIQGVGWVEGTASVNDGIFHNVAVTQRSTFVDFYVDGKLDRIRGSAASPSTVGEDLAIGARNDGTFNFDGQIEYVLIYNRVLLASEIALLHAIPYAPLILKDDYWGFLAPAAAAVNINQWLAQQAATGNFVAQQAASGSWTSQQGASSTWKKQQEN